MKYILIALVAFVLVVAGYYFFIYEENTYIENYDPAISTSNKNDAEDIPEVVLDFDKQQYSIDDQTSLWVVVNKDRPIDTGYVPEGLVDVDVAKRTDKSAQELMLRPEAASALIKLFNSASNAGQDLLMGSAYRSAELQNTYYSNYVNSYGQAEADKFSARPGTSEHQTGLGVDVSRSDLNCYLETCFGDTAEGQWVAKNAHLYGFVIRYPEGKESITGYQYEPWHLRYVGVGLASEIYDKNQTLEEYFDLI